MMHRSGRPGGAHAPFRDEQESPFLFESLDPSPPAEEFEDDEASFDDELESEEEAFEDEGSDVEAEWESEHAYEHEAPCSCGARAARETVEEEAPLRGSPKLLRALAQAHRALGAVLRELERGQPERELEGEYEADEEHEQDDGQASHRDYEADEDLDVEESELEGHELHEHARHDEELEDEELEGEAFEDEGADEGEAYADEGPFAQYEAHGSPYSHGEADEDLDVDETPFANEGADYESYESPFLSESPFQLEHHDYEASSDLEREKLRWAQTVLNHTEGERLDTDGRMGPLTRGALTRFQGRYGLAQSGALDTPTQVALLQRGIEQTKLQSIFPSYGQWTDQLSQRISELRTSQGASFMPLFDDVTRNALLSALGGGTSSATSQATPGASMGGGSTGVVIERAIASLVDELQNVKVHGLSNGVTKQWGVHVPYYIDRAGNTKNFMLKYRDGVLKNAGLRALYDEKVTVGKNKQELRFKRARKGKATAEDIREFLQAALDRNLVPGQADGTLTGAKAKLFLRKLGLGVDCSGFVAQALNACARAVGSSTKGFTIDETHSSALKVGNKLPFVKVARPVDLLPGDTMWREGHIRIVHQVKIQSNGKVVVRIAESTSIDGMGPTYGDYTFSDGQSLNSLVLSKKLKWKPSDYKWSRYKPLADAYAQGASATPSTSPAPAPVVSTQPAPASSGTNGKARSWSHVSYAVPGAMPNPSHYRKFRITTYHIADEEQSPVVDVKVPVRSKDGKILAHVSPKFFAEMSLQGSGRLKDGTLLNTTGKKHFIAVNHDEYAAVKDYHLANYKKAETRFKFGYSGLRVDNGRVTAAMTFSKKDGSAYGYGQIRDTPHTPFRTLAVDMGLVDCSDRSVKGGLVPAHTRVFIPWFKGRTMPDGTLHDGWFVAIDNGGGIYGAHFDVFSGSKAWGKKLAKDMRDSKQSMDRVAVWFPGIENRMAANYSYGLERGDCDKRKGNV